MSGNCLGTRVQLLQTVQVYETPGQLKTILGYLIVFMFGHCRYVCQTFLVVGWLLIISFAKQKQQIPYSHA